MMNLAVSKIKDMGSTKDLIDKITVLVAGISLSFTIPKTLKF